MRVAVTAPDGQTGVVAFEWRSRRVASVRLLECRCGCGDVFAPSWPGQIYLDRWHRAEFHNERRRRH